jgi:hypothetical protein
MAMDGHVRPPTEKPLTFIRRIIEDSPFRGASELADPSLEWLVRTAMANQWKLPRFKNWAGIPMEGFALDLQDLQELLGDNPLLAPGLLPRHAGPGSMLGFLERKGVVIHAGYYHTDSDDLLAYSGIDLDLDQLHPTTEIRTPEREEVDGTYSVKLSREPDLRNEGGDGDP